MKLIFLFLAAVVNIIFCAYYAYHHWNDYAIPILVMIEIMMWFSGYYFGLADEKHNERIKELERKIRQ